MASHGRRFLLSIAHQCDRHPAIQTGVGVLVTARCVLTGTVVLAATVLGCASVGLPATPPLTPERLVAEGQIVPPSDTGHGRSDLGWVYVPVTIQGTPMTVVADLGAYLAFSGTVSHMSVEPGIPATALLNDETNHTMVLDSLGIGTAVEHHVPFEYDADYTDTDPPAGLPRLAGLLGNDVLSHYDFVFDGPARRVRLYQPPPVAPTAGVPRDRLPAWLPPGLTPPDCVPMRQSRKDVFVTVYANGHAMQGIIDSGSWSTNMNMAAATALGLTPTSPTVHPYASSMSMNGVKASFEATGVEVRLGAHRLAAVPVVIFEQITIPGTGAEPVLNLGMNAIQDRLLFVSYRSGQVCLGPRH